MNEQEDKKKKKKTKLIANNLIEQQKKYSIFIQKGLIPNIDNNYSYQNYFDMQQKLIHDDL